MASGKIGLFGGAGSGKSLVAEIFKTKYNALIIEADKVAHKLYEKNAAGYNELVKLFGNEILNDDYNIDRNKLGDILYSNEGSRLKVNEIIHPLVYKEIEKLCSEYHGLVIYEAAILPETDEIKDELNLDCAIYVYSSEDTRRKRLKETRGYSDERVDQILTSQADEQSFRSFCDYVIDNNGNLEELEREVDAAFEYCQRKQR